MNMTPRQKLFAALVAAATAFIGALLGVKVEMRQHQVADKGCCPCDPPKKEPPAPGPNPLEAIARIQRANVGCSATIIGPRRDDGRYWVLTAAHCVDRVGERWGMHLRDGRRVGMQIVNMDKRADYAWGLTDTSAVEYPYALVEDRTPPIGTKVWHAGFGVHVPGNREDGTIIHGPDGNGQIRFRLSVSSGDSGGGILIDSDGHVVSTVCCTTRPGAFADVWGASPEAFLRGRVSEVNYDEWTPIPIPQRMHDEKEK